jgi:hypothetical protein
MFKTTLTAVGLVISLSSSAFAFDVNEGVANIERAIDEGDLLS